MEIRPHRRRDEQFTVDDALRARVRGKLARKARIVAGRRERPAHRREDQQKLLKIGETIDRLRVPRARDFGARPVPRGDTVALRQFEKRLRPERPFQVTMQVDFG